MSTSSEDKDLWARFAVAAVEGYRPPDDVGDVDDLADDLAEVAAKVADALLDAYNDRFTTRSRGRSRKPDPDEEEADR